ncbi:MAG: V-type ATP synthase subunit E [Candidatus Micrarchaeia archaeon]
MPLEKVREEILAKANAAARKAISEAEAQAAQVVANAQAEAKQIEEDAKASLDAEIKALEASIGAEAEMFESGAILEARQHVADKLLARLMPKIRKSIKKEGYVKMISSAVSLAKKSMPGESISILASRSDAPLLKKLGIDANFGDVKNGIIIYSSDGKVKIDATIDSQITGAIESIKSAIMSELFGAAPVAAAPPKPRNVKKPAIKGRRASKRARRK